MFDIFGIKARRKAKKEAEEKKELERVAEKKRIYQERKEKIDSYLKVYDEEFDAKANEEYEKELKEIEERNSTCPKCGSKNIVHKVKRAKGEIHGEGNSSGFGYIGGSFLGIGGSFYSHGHSTIDGELDTLQINRCKDCEEEWNIEEADGPSYFGNAFSHYDSFTPGFLYRRIEEYYELKYDPYDVKNKCNSLEEMQQEFLEQYANGHHFDDYKKAPRYMLEYAIYQGFTEHYYYEDYLDKKLFNYHSDDDKYSYTMSDEMWEVVKKLVGWEGDE